MWFPIAFLALLISVSAFGRLKKADPDSDTQKIEPAVAPAGEE